MVRLQGRAGVAPFMVTRSVLVKASSGNGRVVDRPQRAHVALGTGCARPPAASPARCDDDRLVAPCRGRAPMGGRSRQRHAGRSAACVSNVPPASASDTDLLLETTRLRSLGAIAGLRAVVPGSRTVPPGGSVEWMRSRPPSIWRMQTRAGRRTVVVDDEGAHAASLRASSPRTASRSMPGGERRGGIP